MGGTMYECMCGKINYMMFILVRLVEKDNDRVIGLQILLSVFAVSPLARRANTRALDYLLSKLWGKYISTLRLRLAVVKD